MKKDLHEDYAALYSAATVPATSEYLFGDLLKLTKDISEVNKFAPRNATLHATEILAQMAVATIMQTRELKAIAGFTHINGQEMIFCPKAALQGQD